MERESLVMQAWRQYTGKLRDVESRSRSVRRLPGATGIYLSAATGCPRKESLRLLKYTAAPFSAQSKSNMAIGVKSEEKPALVLEAAGWRLKRQEPVQTKYGNGRIDILGYPPSGEEVIIEIKTSTLGSLNYLPRREHLDQTILYMGFLHEESPTVPLGELIYILRSEQNGEHKEQIKVFVVEWDRLRFEYLIERLELIDSHVKNGEPVPLEMCKDVAPDKAPCSYPNTGKCVYFEHCWGGVQLPTQELLEI
jgi:CRISPR/Cas system-associated exonuclease Cas4 (RecB family)